MATSTKKATTKKTSAAAKKRAQETGFPESGANTLRDNATSAGEIASRVDGNEDSGANRNAASMDAAGEALDATEAQATADEDKSIAGRIRRSGLVFVREHISGAEYVGTSPQSDPNSAYSSRERAAVFPLDSIPPRTGMQVRPKDGEPFTIPDGFFHDSKPEDWGRVTRPDGKSLF